MLYSTVSSPTLPQTEHRLAPALERLQRVLAADCPGNDQEWASGCWYSVARLERKLRQHLEEVKSADGSSTLVDPTRPSLLRHWEDVLHAYSDLLESVMAIKWELYHLAQGTSKAAPSRENLRRRLEHVLSALQHHLKAETDLIMESVVTDIGVGD